MYIFLSYICKNVELKLDKFGGFSDGSLRP